MVYTIILDEKLINGCKRIFFLLEFVMFSYILGGGKPQNNLYSLPAPLILFSATSAETHIHYLASLIKSYF
jgi:hypothetical protein